MNFVALISGGKDSIYALTKCVESGHKLICLANLYPPANISELDSYMYQSVGAEIIETIASALEYPLVRGEITGKPVELGLGYQKTPNDEVEDLFELLKKVKDAYPEVQAVSSGAIKSTYQKNRVEEICGRLGLVSLAPLWDREPKALITEMAEHKLEGILVRICSWGLKKNHLGKSIVELKDYLISLQDKYDVHCCGEGGEFETIVVDCPMYKRRIIIEEAETIIEMENDLQLRARLFLKKFKLQEK
jgi:diphthine-ammonia ligase